MPSHTYPTPAAALKIVSFGLLTLLYGQNLQITENQQFHFDLKVRIAGRRFW